MNHPTTQSFWKSVFCLILIACIGIALRIPDVSQGLTNDEQLWLDRAYDFLRQAHLAGSISGYKPKYNVNGWPHVQYQGQTLPFNIIVKASHRGYVSAMLIGAGMKLLLPAQPAVGHLIRIRLVQSTLLVLYALVWFCLLMKLFGVRRLLALFFSLFVVTATTILGESRMIKQDVMLLVFLSSSVFLFSLFLEQRKDSYLYSAGMLLGIACATKMVSLLVVALNLLILLVLALRKEDWIRWRTIGLYSFIVYLIALVLSPNVWGHPLTGWWDVIKVGLASPQAAGGKWQAIANFSASMKTLAHLSIFFPPLLALAALSLIRHHSLNKVYVFLCIIVMVFVIWRSTMKDPRYLLPAVPLALFMSLGVLDNMVKQRRMLPVLCFLVVFLLVHFWDFVNLYPYHFQSGSILLPQIAAYLEERQIGEVQVCTGKEVLSYYYCGRATDLSNWKSGWFLIGRKYYARIPPDIGLPEKVFMFGHQEIYRLYRASDRE